MSYKERTIIMAKIDYDNLTKQIVEYVGGVENIKTITHCVTCLLYTSPSPRDRG